MAEITAALVKDLREKTGAGMMDCKKALTESGGDMEAATDWLRKKGLSAAVKKGGRVAAEGLVGVASDGTKAAMVEVNSETDFVGRNEAFQALVEGIAKVALQVGDDVEAIRAAHYPGTGRTVADEITHAIATIGENMTLRRAKVLHVGSGVVATYMHNALKPTLGKIGVLVAMESANPADTLDTLGRQVGMHVAATQPAALDIDSVDPADLERERTVLTEQGPGRPQEPGQEGRDARQDRGWADPQVLPAGRAAGAGVGPRRQEPGPRRGGRGRRQAGGLRTLQGRRGHREAVRRLRRRGRQGVRRLHEAGAGPSGRRTGLSRPACALRPDVRAGQRQHARRVRTPGARVRHARPAHT